MAAKAIAPTSGLAFSESAPGGDSADQNGVALQARSQGGCDGQTSSWALLLKRAPLGTRRITRRNLVPLSPMQRSHQARSDRQACRNLNLGVIPQLASDPPRETRRKARREAGLLGTMVCSVRGPRSAGRLPHAPSPWGPRLKPPLQLGGFLLFCLARRAKRRC